MIRDTLAAWRLLRLLHSDELTRPAREAAMTWALRRPPVILGTLPRIEALRHPPLHPRVAYMLGCEKCLAVWAALGVVLVRRRAPWLRDALALAQAAALLEEYALKS